MQIPRVIRWGFDPDKSTLEVLKQPDSRLIWGILRTGHIVDQDFNGDIAALVQSLRDDPPANAEALASRAWDRFGLYGFGTTGTGAGRRQSAPDMEYWTELFQAWSGHLVVQHEVAGS